MVALADNKHLRMLGDLRRQASVAAQSSNFYNWLLSSGTMPRSFAVKMIDPWPGQAEVGRTLCKGLFTAQGANIPFAQDLWAESDAFPQWQGVLHSFGWLRDLRALGGDAARKVARDLVGSWLHQNGRWDQSIWRADILGQRISMWISSYDFFCASANQEYQDRTIACLVRQARHLSRIFPGDLHGVELLRAARGLIFAGLALPDREEWVVQGFDVVLKELPVQILSDGGHVSRSPQQLAETVQIMLDLRCALYRSNLSVPETLQRSLERAGATLKFFRHADRKLALFHGSQQGDVAVLDVMLSQLAQPGKAAKNLPASGFERVSIGKSLLMLDASAVPAAPHDRASHSAPLAFEFSYGRDRIFSNCGSHPHNADWRQVLRHTAAHNSLTINGLPVHEFSPEGSVMRPHGEVSCSRQDSKGACLLDAVHEGYARAGVTHRRRLYLSTQGHDLRGEETLSAAQAPRKPRRIDLRFHLHPGILVDLSDDGKEALLQLPGGSTWRFFSMEGKLTLENSIAFHNGIRPHRTRQLVVVAGMESETLQIKWALQRL